MRLIDADAFKKYIRDACNEMSHVYKDGGKWAKQITEDFCMDIDEQPTAQQWIPCSKEEHPSDNREVEVTCEFKRYDGEKIRYTCHASYVHRYSIESMPYDNWIDCEEYNEEKDMYYALPGWYERVHNWDDYSHCAINDHVVAWRELSEPWKGEQDG